MGAAEEWVSRADAARLAGCSEDTIRRDVRQHGVATQPGGPHGQVLVSVADLVRLGRVPAHALVPGAGATGSAEVLRARETVTELRVELARVGAQLDDARASAEELRTQLDRYHRLLQTMTRTHERLVTHLEVERRHPVEMAPLEPAPVQAVPVGAVPLESPDVRPTAVEVTEDRVAASGRGRDR